MCTGAGSIFLLNSARPVGRTWLVTERWGALGVSRVHIAQLVYARAQHIALPFCEDGGVHPAPTLRDSLATGLFRALSRSQTDRPESDWSLRRKAGCHPLRRLSDRLNRALTGRLPSSLTARYRLRSWPIPCCCLFRCPLRCDTSSTHRPAGSS